MSIFYSRTKILIKNQITIELTQKNSVFFLIQEQKQYINNNNNDEDRRVMRINYFPFRFLYCLETNFSFIW